MGSGCLVVCAHGLLCTRSRQDTSCSVFAPQLPGLNAYRGYCSNQLAAKALLDQKKQDPRVQDFLQRCLESPFSRKLDLWSFLDIPRSRLVKYPLLLKEILRHTPKDHLDVQLLEKAVSEPIKGLASLSWVTLEKHTVVLLNLTSSKDWVFI